MNEKEKPNTLIVCVNRRLEASGPSCAARGSEEIADALEKGVTERNIDVVIERICCLGHCAEGPTLRLVPGGSFLQGTRLEDVPALLDDLAHRCAKD